MQTVLSIKNRPPKADNYLIALPFGRSPTSTSSVHASLPFGKTLLAPLNYSVFNGVNLKGRKGLTTVYLGETRRKPRPMLLSSGGKLVRRAARQLRVSLLQLPPRHTRYDPDDAPLGLVCADVE